MARRTAWRKLSEGPLSPPLFQSNPCVDTSARPYHHRPLFSWMLGRGRWQCHKHLYRFCVPTCCQQALISPNNCTAPVLSKAFVGSPPSPNVITDSGWRYLSVQRDWSFCVLSDVLQERLFDVHSHSVARIHTMMMKSRFWRCRWPQCCS